jgi:hypothetical protein
MHPVWNWFQSARKQVKSGEFNDLTDRLTEDEVAEAYDFLFANPHLNQQNFMGIVRMIQGD